MDTRESRKILRQQLRAKRSALSPEQQKNAAQKLLHEVQNHPYFINAENIAAYLPNDGEIDPRPIIELALYQDKKCFLPVIDGEDHGRMQFAHYDKSTLLRSNAFDIDEPEFIAAQSIAPENLDIVLMPLVGFDNRGGRLGMGGGLYDRIFAFKRQQGKIKPYLMGIAHECQRLDELPTEDWDIPLDAVISIK